MKNTKYCLILIAFAILYFGCKKNEAGQELPNHEILLLVSLDGFRYDYFEKTNTPGLDRLIENGVKAESLVPVFPSFTFPNHYTQVTGLYPENHGIVANTIYNPATNDWYTIGTGSTAVAESQWYSGEPIWVTAEKQGLVSATYFWPGSEAEIQGERPTHWKTYDGNVANSDRVDQVLDWLALPNGERPSFISLYFSDVDSYGHFFGPDASEMVQAIQQVDNAISSLLNGIEDLGLEDNVNIMVISDHGMAQLDRDRVIFLDDYLPNQVGNAQIVASSSLLGFHATPSEGAIIYDGLKDAHPNMQVFWKDSVPDRLHYSDHELIPDILGILDEGWSITSRDYFDNNPTAFTGGTHGYDFEYPSMHGIFIAKGPAFRQNIQPAAFQSVHLYELMCKILNLTPAANDGNLSEVENLLQ